MSQMEHQHQPATDTTAKVFPRAADTDQVCMRQHSNRSSTANDWARPRSMFVSRRDLSPQSAPLWRNAPSHHHHHHPAMVQTAELPPVLHNSAQQRNHKVFTPPRVISPAVSFQQSLRSYPTQPHQPQQQQPQQQPIAKSANYRAKNQVFERVRKEPLPRRVPPQNQPENHVTNLDGEQSTPFFLDYLDSQSHNSDPMAPSFSAAFNRNAFMEMFREPGMDGVDGCSAATDSRVSSVAPLASAESGSLPYTVNNDHSVLDQHANRSGVDSLISQTSEQGSFYLGQGATNRQRNGNGSALSTRASGGSVSFGQQQHQQGKCANSKESVILRRNSTRAMENNNSRSTSNLNQRLQMVAERRAQIEDAKRERVQRQIEQVARTAPPPLPGVSQNPSVAFGSTRPRNIDLTRPLVTPIPAARPKSEIFPSSFGYGGGSAGGHTVIDSPSTPVAPVYSKDDANYYQGRGSRVPLRSAPTMSPSMTQSMSVSSFQQQQPASAPSYRAVRRHDPELVPAMQKYMFREYAMPTSNTPVMRKENSLMTASMMSTKSFQASSSIYRTPFGGPGARPKKSFSMNRLDQLAQPRRRVEPKVPTSASFIKTREPLSSAKKPSSFDGDSSSSSRGVKPLPPPKTLFKSSPKPVPKESGSSSSAGSGGGRPAITPKPRPLSQFEPMSKAAAHLIDTTPVQIPQPAAAASAPAPVAPSAPTAAAQPTNEEGDNKDEPSEADKLAEYKRALAEKRAMYRKQQEEKPQVPTRRAKIVKPEPATVKPEEDEHEEDDKHSSSSSSSSSSDSESEDEQQKPKEVQQATVIPSSEAQSNGSVAVVEAVVEDVPTEQLISIEADKEPQEPREPFKPKALASDNLMTTSLTGDFATLSVSDNNNNDKLLANASMTASFDASLLSDATNSNNSNANTSSTGGQRPQSLTLTKEQLEERSAILLQQEKAEREKRKNRVQEILKRTRKDEKKDEDKDGGDSPTNMDSNGSDNGNGSDSNGSDSNGPESNGPESNGPESNGPESNGPETTTNGQTSSEGTNGVVENGNTNGHSMYNGVNGLNGDSNGKVESNGINSNHHRDMKHFVSENEQSLPPTNGF